MTRLSAAIGAMVLILAAGTANAVGLGNITLRSALTEPLDAEIQITNPAGLSADDLTISLGSEADFRRAGVERPIFLQQIEFSLTEDGDDILVQVSTDEAVQEPFLDFLLELRWPSGRLVREYTLLLDPPTFLAEDSSMAQVFPAEDPFAAESAATPEPEPLPQPQPVGPERRIEQLPDNQYRVANNDTLWEIALRTRTDPSQTPQQIMLAIQDLNPEAFINENINRVRAGRLLNLPDAEQVAVRSVTEATQEVNRQNAALRGAPPPGETQISATDATESAIPAGPGGRDPDGFLEVITDAGEPDEATTAEGDATEEITQLQNELAIQRELNDEMRLQSEEQQSRLAELEEQVELLSRLVELQSASASQLQAATEALEAEQAEPLADTETAPEAEAEPAPTEPPTLETPVSQPLTLFEQAVRWVSQPYNAVLLLLLLLLVLLLVNWQRKRNAEGNDTEETLEVDESLMAEDDVDDTESLDDDLDGLDDLDSDSDEVGATRGSGTVGVAGAAVAAEAIENAELYMAFQRYDEAETALKAAIEQNPDEPSLQLKLMELYAETGNAGAFEAMAEGFHGDQAAVEGLRQQMHGPDGGSSSNKDDLSDDLSYDSLSSDLDDLDLDFNDSGDLSPQGDLDDDDLSLEFDLGSDFDADPSDEEPSPRDDSRTTKSDDLTDFELPELDEEFDTDFDSGVVPEAPRAGDVENDGESDDERDDGMSDLDFNMDFKSSTETRQPNTPSSIEQADRADKKDDDQALDFEVPELNATIEADADSDLPPAVTNDTTGDLADDELEADDQDWSMDLSDEAELSDDDLDFDFGDLESDDDLTSDLTEDSADEQGRDDVRSTEPKADDEGPVSKSDDALSHDGDIDAGEALDDDWDDDFDFLDGTDEVSTKLDLARAYVDMEDPEGARDILSEVLEEGDESQKADARKLLESLQR